MPFQRPHYHDDAGRLARIALDIILVSSLVTGTAIGIGWLAVH